MNTNFLYKTITVKKLILPAILILTVIGSGGYLYWSLSTDFQNTKKDLYNQVLILENILASTTYDKGELSDALTSEQSKSKNLSDNLLQMQNSVGDLIKVSKIDPELLKKYSKVYFLNENYTPAKLTNIDSQYLLEPKRQLQINDQVLPFLQKMIESAKKDNISLEVASAYRSFSEQSALKSNYKITYGLGANKFSADQGYSEHQLGTTVDLTTLKIGGALVGFDKTDSYVWLQNNAYRYGFTLSYPQGNKYYIFEPWHWRFVGVVLATTLHDNGKYFYDLDQRTIDPYLITLFDE